MSNETLENNLSILVQEDQVYIGRLAPTPSGLMHGIINFLDSMFIL
jgi:hypothetical protein